LQLASDNCADIIENVIEAHLTSPLAKFAPKHASPSLPLLPKDIPNQPIMVSSDAFIKDNIFNTAPLIPQDNLKKGTKSGVSKEVRIHFRIPFIYTSS
jgi:hypothetical protein